mmetsp:Transcript_21083/g.67948  ORF Transcript_21083/g.67948 Transcript_21083/m.67948 type:complete len:98 (+) Transcript_21083:462-755(+)
MVCAQRGYDCVICMAEPFSVERRRLMRMLGAKVIVTPKAGKGTGMVRKAEELCATHGWFLCHQASQNPLFRSFPTQAHSQRNVPYSSRRRLIGSSTS